MRQHKSLCNNIDVTIHIKWKGNIGTFARLIGLSYRNVGSDDKHVQVFIIALFVTVKALGPNCLKLKYSNQL